MIDKTIPVIGNFPKDDKLRVVWMYGAVYKNIGRTRAPEIKIMLKEVLPSGKLSTTQIFRKISIAQLDTVRHMTIWRGNRRTISTWKSFGDSYEEDKLPCIYFYLHVSFLGICYFARLTQNFERSCFTSKFLNSL